MKRLFCLPFLIAIFCISAFAQREVYGRVVQVIDGRTVVILVSTGNKLTAELQYLEVPEPEQILHQTVIDHLSQLLIDQKVVFRAHRLIPTKTVGQLLVNGVDVSQQMIRDGAAWYNVEEKAGLDAPQSEVYQQTEAQAKLEKLGVWSIPDLKPSWEIRSERAEAEQQRQTLAAEKARAEAKLVNDSATAEQKHQPQIQQLSSESQMLAATSGSVGRLPSFLKNVGGLLMGYEPSLKLSIVLTPLYTTRIPEIEGSGTFSFQVLYMYYDANESRGRQSVYIFGIDSVSKDFNFLKDNTLVVTADGQKIVIGKAKRFTRPNEQGVKESLSYELKKPTLEKIAGAKNLSIKVGGFSKILDANIQMMLNNLLQASQ